MAAAIEELGLTTWAQSLPEDIDTRLGPDGAGLDTVVDHRGVKLSGGQVQRLALARPEPP